MITALLLLTLIFSIPQEPKIVTCTVVKVDLSVACPEGGGTVLIELTDAAEAKQFFDEWRLVAPLRGGRVNTDAPLGTRTLKADDKVKAVLEAQKFTPIVSCEVRVWRNIKAWRQFKEGERVPNTLFTLPDDCQPFYGKN